MSLCPFHGRYQLLNAWQWQIPKSPAVTFCSLPGITNHATQYLPVDIPHVIKRVRDGDRSAFAELVAHYQRPLFGYLGRMGQSQAAAEDLAQETFLRAWTSLGSYDPARAAFSTWLFTIARNLLQRNVSCPLTKRCLKRLAKASSRPRPCNKRSASSVCRQL